MTPASRFKSILAPAPGIIADGHKRRAHVLRVILSHSRKGYSEAVLKQSTESFIRVLENAFYSFGGVPQTVGRVE